MTSTFGAEFIKDWPNRSPIWSNFGIKQMKLCESELKAVPLSREEILENSSSFPLKVCLLAISQSKSYWFYDC